MTVSINGTNGLVFNDGSSQATAATGFGFKNRIINGAMVIDQRNAGASVTPIAQQYLCDRWKFGLTAASKFTAQQNAGSVTPPAGFTNYLGVTSSSAYSVSSSDVFYLAQAIEGLNISDLAWGTANAATVTLSFWVRSSLTGTFGGSVGNNGTTNYPFSYTISSANTWEQKTITIVGPTSGTFATTSAAGILLSFSLGAGSTYSGTAGAWAISSFIVQPTGATSVVGTSGATFYITGVQLEKGSTATSFDYRPYGTELALCQRYYYKSIFAPISGYSPTTSRADGTVVFPVPMRDAPAALETTGTASDYGVYFQSGGVLCNSIPNIASPTTIHGGYVRFNCPVSFSIGQGCLMAPYTTGAYLAWSAEL